MSEFLTPDQRDHIAAAYHASLTEGTAGGTYTREVLKHVPDLLRDIEHLHSLLTKAHRRETTTPLADGTLLADCSCGDTYSVPQGGDEYAALEAAHLAHVGAID